MTSARDGDGMDETFYELLGVDEDVDAAELKAAYRRAVRSAHPDTGGSAERFRATTSAFEMLSDPRLRAFYDAELLLARVRTAPAERYIPLSDVVHDLGLILGRTPDVAGNGSGRQAPPPRADATADAGAEQGARQDDATSDGDADDRREAAGDATAGRPRREPPGADVADAVAAHVRAQMRKLRRVPAVTRLYGAAAGAAVALATVGLWLVGLVPALLGIDDGDPLGFGRIYNDPVAVTADTVISAAFLGAAAGMAAAVWMVRWRRTWRRPDWAAKALAAAWVVAVVTLPAWVGRWEALVGAIVVVLVDGQLRNPRPADFLATPEAAALGLTSRRNRCEATLTAEEHERLLEERRFADRAADFARG